LTRYVHKNYVSTGSKQASNKAAFSGSSSASTYKALVIGQFKGDGTIAGALTWSRDQINGTMKGYNLNKGRISKNSKCWAGWCLAFWGTAYGRSKPLL